MVECTFGDQAREVAWNEWYVGHIKRLLTVTGISTAQRFRAVGDSQPKYRAMYTVESEKVFNTADYAGIKGGNFPSEWQSAVSSWRRTVFDGIVRAPEVPAGSYLLIVDEGKKAAAAAAAQFQWMSPIALDASAGVTGIAVLAREIAQTQSFALGSNVSVYAPISDYLSSDQG